MGLALCRAVGHKSAYGKGAKHRRKLISGRSACEPAAGKLGGSKQRDRESSANASAEKPEPQKVPLEVIGNEFVLGPNQMQHFNNGAIRGHCGVRSKRHRKHGGEDHQRQYHNSANQHDSGQ